jgi:hypothetical protein
MEILASPAAVVNGQCVETATPMSSGSYRAVAQARVVEKTFTSQYSNPDDDTLWELA